MADGHLLQQDRAALALRSLHHACEKRNRTAVMFRGFGGLLMVDVYRNRGPRDFTQAVRAPWVPDLVEIERRVLAC